MSTNITKQEESLEDAAKENALRHEGILYEDKARRHFVSGANWQKERDKEKINILLNALKITMLYANEYERIYPGSISEQDQSILVQAEQTINTNK